MTGILLSLQFTIMTYLLIGFALYRVKIITPDVQRNLSMLVMEVILPVSVFASSLQSLSINTIQRFLPILGIAVFIEGVLLIATKKPLKSLNSDENCVVRYGVLVSNGGLIGTPVMEELLGPIGAVMCNVFMIPTRAVTYSAGELIFGKERNKSVISALIRNKVIIAMGLALIMQTLHISIPTPCLTALKNLGNCLSPVAIITIGSMLADYGIPKKEMVYKITFICIVRLLLIPLTVLSFCYIFSADFINTTVIVLLLGMPVGTVIAIHAKEYQGDSAFASAVVLATTLLSTVSLVGLMKIIEFLY